MVHVTWTWGNGQLQAAYVFWSFRPCWNILRCRAQRLSPGPFCITDTQHNTAWSCCSSPASPFPGKAGVLSLPKGHRHPPEAKRAAGLLCHPDSYPHQHHHLQHKPPFSIPPQGLCTDDSFAWNVLSPETHMDHSFLCYKSRLKQCLLLRPSWPPSPIFLISLYCSSSCFLPSDSIFIYLLSVSFSGV